MLFQIFLNVLLKSVLTVKPIIVMLKSWKYKQDVYWNRPRRFENDQRKLDENSFSVSLDLKRYYPLKNAQGIKEMDYVSFLSADVKCSLAIRFKNGTIK